MLKFKEYLEEKVINIGLNPDHEKHRETYRGEIHDILHSSYKKAGGYMSHESGSREESEAIHNDISTRHIKAIKRDGRISAVRLYRDHHGRKVVAGGTNQTDSGKADYKKILHDDNKQKRSWGEVSGAAETIQRRMNVPVLPSHKAHKLVNADDIEIIDHEKYIRKIGPHKHTKIIMGHPKMDNKHD